MSENATRLKAVLLAVGIFAVGITVGATYHLWLPAGGDKQTQAPREHRRTPRMGATSERLLKRYSRHLDLTEAQKAEIDQILDQSRELIVEVRKNIGSKIETVRRGAWARIRVVLTPDQQEIFDELTSPASPNIILRQLRRRLDLGEAQQAEVSRILKENWAEMRKLRRGIREELKAMHKDSRTEQMSLLTPVQRKRSNGGWDMDLSGEQRAKMEQIRKKGREATRRLFQSRDEQLAYLIGKTWSEIKTLLREEQVGKFEEITSGIERRMRWERQFRRRPGGRSFDF
ncbi:MAG: hypothetical protein J4F39_12450 [Candidatus Latescibacteria bacterium]|nr:hypothetical protein [Candidatus Latescibacterota bacterium]